MKASTLSGDRHRDVQALGHLFGPELVCDCGAVWSKHQDVQTSCQTTTSARHRRMQRHRTGSGTLETSSLEPPEPAPG